MKKKKGYRGLILPFYTPPHGKSQWAVPGVIYEPFQAISRLMAPITSKAPPQSLAQQSADAITALSIFGGAGIARAGARPLVSKIVAKRAAKRYNFVRHQIAPEPQYMGGLRPDKIPQRKFEYDYHGAVGSPGSILEKSIEGLPLRAKYISGRRTVGGRDSGLGVREQRAVTELLSGRSPLRTPAKELPRRTVGTYRHGPAGSVREIRYSEALKPSQIDEVIAHETGHMIDEIAGQIPTKGAVKEFARIWGEVNTGQYYRNGRGLMKPEAMGYSKSEAPREMVADTIRSYMQNPNYVKTVAPKAAARIREAVNVHPEISKIVQFNSDVSIVAGAINLGNLGNHALAKDQPATRKARFTGTAEKRPAIGKVRVQMQNGTVYYRRRPSKK